MTNQRFRFILFCFCCTEKKKKNSHACWFEETEEENESKGENKWINCYSRRVARPLKKLNKLFGDCYCVAVVLQ